MPQPNSRFAIPASVYMHGVVVGADEQPVALEVVAGVDDDGQVRADLRLQAVGELGAADAPGQRDDAHVRSPVRARRGARASRSIVSRSNGDGRRR